MTFLHQIWQTRRGKFFRTVASFKLWLRHNDPASLWRVRAPLKQKKKKILLMRGQRKLAGRWFIEQSRKTRWPVLSALSVFPFFSPEIRMGELATVLEKLAEKSNTGWKFTGSRQRSEITMALPQVSKGHNLTAWVANPLTTRVQSCPRVKYLCSLGLHFQWWQNPLVVTPMSLEHWMGFSLGSRKPARVTKIYFSPLKAENFPSYPRTPFGVGAGTEFSST